MQAGCISHDSAGAGRGETKEVKTGSTMSVHGDWFSVLSILLDHCAPAPSRLLGAEGPYFALALEYLWVTLAGSNRASPIPLAAGALMRLGDT